MAAQRRKIQQIEDVLERKFLLLAGNTHISKDEIKTPDSKVEKEIRTLDSKMLTLDSKNQGP